jgi:hypothetical protein
MLNEFNLSHLIVNDQFAQSQYVQNTNFQIYYFFINIDAIIFLIDYSFFSIICFKDIIVLII